MAYTIVNYKTKRALKEALKLGVPIKCFNPDLGGDLNNHSGTVSLEGPHFPQPHTWYAQGEMKDGFLIKVK